MYYLQRYQIHKVNMIYIKDFWVAVTELNLSYYNKGI